METSFKQEDLAATDWLAIRWLFTCVAAMLIIGMMAGMLIMRSQYSNHEKVSVISSKMLQDFDEAERLSTERAPDQKPGHDIQPTDNVTGKNVHP